MRKMLVISLFFVACGGSHQPAESADTASLEASESSKSAPAEKAEKTEPAAAASASAPASEAPAPASSANSDTSAPPSPARPAPAVTGLIDGKPFSPKVARILAKAQKDGRVTLTLDESHTDCSAGTPSPGEGTLTMLVPWENGYKSDLGALKRSTPKKPGGEIGFSRARAGGKKDISATFKPAGTVTIVKAPTEQNARGQLKIDLTSGDFMLAGDLDVLLCTAPK